MINRFNALPLSQTPSESREFLETFWYLSAIVVNSVVYHLNKVISWCMVLVNVTQNPQGSVGHL